MAHRPTRSAGLFLAGQILIIAGLGYGLSYIPIGPQMLLWLILAAVAWIGLLAVYVLSAAVDRVAERLDTISKQLNLTPQEKDGSTTSGQPDMQKEHHQVFVREEGSG
jgi:membrane protein implicated in regulation of membrane protease activity